VVAVAVLIQHIQTLELEARAVVEMEAPQEMALMEPQTLEAVVVVVQTTRQPQAATAALA
jgi:hypothetical protein